MNPKTRLFRKPYAKTHESFGNSWNLKRTKNNITVKRKTATGTRLVQQCNHKEEK